MLRSFRLGTAFNIPLYVHWSFFLLPLWVLLAGSAQGAAGVLFSQAVLVGVFACVLAHELGHALMARYFGIPTRDITLYPIGGVARLESTGATPAQELAIALAGPAVNLALVVLLLPVALLHLLAVQAGSAVEPLLLLGRYLTVLWGANGMLLAFNLLPAFPMDGGRVLRALLELPLGRLRATEIAASVGLVLAVLLGVAGLWVGQLTLLLVALFVGFAGQAELRALRHAEADTPELVEPIRVEARREAGPPGFTGFAWDRQARVWVRWVNGRPVEVFG